MDRERAETFLRLLVETELRRLAEQPGDLAVQAGCITRVIQVARALIAVRALGDEVAGQVLDDFEQALGRWRAWPPGRAGRDLRWLIRSTPPRRSPPASDLAVAVGQVIPVRDEQVSGEATVLSYAQTESGALLTIVAQPGQLSPVDPEGPWHTRPGPPGVRRQGPLMIPFRQFTATDDQGACYQMSYIGNGSWPREWTLRLYPRPPRDLRWLDLSTTPGEPAVRIDLSAAGQPPASPAVTVSEVTRRPAEQLLNNIALRLLTTGTVFPQYVRVLLSEFALRQTGPLPGTADGLGDVIAALQTSGACHRSARCPASSPRYAHACTSPATASPRRPPPTCPNHGSACSASTSTPPRRPHPSATAAPSPWPRSPNSTGPCSRSSA